MNPLKLDKVPEKEIHFRWLAPNKLKIITIDDRKLDLILLVRTISKEDELLVFFDDKIFDFKGVTKEGKK